jgi:thiamine monophosphate synthase
MTTPDDPTVEQARAVLAQEKRHRAETFARELQELCDKHGVDLVVSPSSIVIQVREGGD